MGEGQLRECGHEPGSEGTTQAAGRQVARIQISHGISACAVYHATQQVAGTNLVPPVLQVERNVHEEPRWEVLPAPGVAQMTRRTTECAALMEGAWGLRRRWGVLHAGWGQVGARTHSPQRWPPPLTAQLHGWAQCPSGWSPCQLTNGPWGQASGTCSQVYLLPKGPSSQTPAVSLGET